MKKDILLAEFEKYLSIAKTANLNNVGSPFQSTRFYSIAHGTEFESALSKYAIELDVNNYRIKDTTLGEALRQAALDGVLDTLSNVVHFLKTDSHIERQRIDTAVMNKISADKIRKTCEEINRESNENQIAMVSLIGIAIQWTIFYKAKISGYEKEDKEIRFEGLIDDVLKNKYYEDNQVNKFLHDYKTNFRKKSYDGIRHSQSYVPDMTQVNDDMRLLIFLLEKTF